MYQDYDGNKTGDSTMLNVYPYTIPDEAQTWDATRFVPDGVVINLGDNDFTNGPPDHDGYVGNYTTLLTRLRASYPRRGSFSRWGR